MKPTVDKATGKVLMHSHDGADVNGLFNASIYQYQVTYNHPRGDSELEGDADYGPNSVFKIGGYQVLMTQDTLIKVIRARVHCTNASRDVTMKVYESDTDLAGNMTLKRLLYSAVIPAASMPHTSVTSDFVLENQVLCRAGKYLQVTWESSALSEIGLRRFTVNSTSPVRLGFLFGAAETSLSKGDVNSGYCGVAMKVTASIDVTRIINPVWTHPRGDSEITGTNDYGTGSVKTLGYSEQMTEQVTFDRLKMNVYCTNASRNIDMYIYIRDTDVAFTINNVAPNLKVTFPAGSFPTAANTGKVFELGQDITVPAGKWLWVLFNNEAQSTTELKMRYFPSEIGSNPARRGFKLSSGLASSVNSASPAATYASTTFQLLHNDYRLVDLQTVLNNLSASMFAFDKITASPMTSDNVQEAIKEAYDHAGGGTALSTTYSNTQSGLTASQVQAAIDELATTRFTRIVLPDEICAVVGDKLQVFTRGIIEAQNPYNEPYEITCSIGNSYPRYFELTPVVADAGTKTLTVTLRDKLGNAISSVSTNLIVKNPTGQPSVNKNVLCIGDSLTAPLVWPQEFYRRITQGGSKFTVSSHNKDASDIGAIYSDSNSNSWTLAEVVSSTILRFTPNSIVPVPSSTGTLTWVSGGDHQTNITYTAVDIYGLGYSNVSFVGNNPFSNFPTQKAIGYGGWTWDTFMGISGLGSFWATSTHDKDSADQKSLYKDTRTKFTCTHDKTFPEDKGAIYQDANNNQWTLYASVTGGLYLQKNGVFADPSGTGTLTWVSGGTHQANITYTAISQAYQQWQIETIEAERIKLIPYGGSNQTPFEYAGFLTWYSGGSHHSNIVFTAAEAESTTPLWDSETNQFSFQGFMDDNYPEEDIDIMYVLLGWNGLSTPNKANADDHATNIAKAQAFIDKFHADFPSAVVRILGLQMPSVNGGIGANYGASASQGYYTFIRSINGWNKALQALANLPANSSFCKYIAVAPVFDNENNCPQASQPVNSRNSATEIRGTNGIHPDTTGYYQIADAAFRDFIRTFCS